MRTLLATSLFAVAVSTSEFLSAPKFKDDESTEIENIADLWWSYWWESDGENNVTFFETWDLKLKGDATWKN